MQVIILKWKNRLEKVCRICAEFKKMMCRIFWRRILTTLFKMLPGICF